jgi:hypothetical protein
LRPMIENSHSHIEHRPSEMKQGKTFSISDVRPQVFD